MFLVRLSVERPVLMTMVIMAFVVLGLFSFMELGVELFPRVDFPIVMVRTVYIGAGPVEIENLITKRIEEQVSAINGVKKIRSTSIEGVSIIAIEFEVGIEVNVAASDVKDKIEEVKSALPEDAFDPVVLKFDIGAEPVMNLAVSSERPLEEIYEFTDDVIKPELMKIQGLAAMNIIGGKIREIQIRLKREMLQSQGIGVMDVIICLSAENLNIPSGRITENRKEYSIRVDGEFDTVDDIRNIIISTKGGGIVRLRDVADVIDDFEEQRLLARFNNISSVGVSLIKRSDANVVQVVDLVKASLEKIEEKIPEDYSINVAKDNSIFIRQSISEVVNNMGIGIILTGVILFLFLHSWQGTLIAAMAMPTSIVATFILIRFAGFTLNFMTLLGLAVTVGVLVTNSIVVLENIIRYVKTGMDAKEAAVKGTTEIAVAVGASTLTNVVVFTPIAFMSGIIGQFFYSFGLTVAFATIFSFFISLTLTPMLASIMLSKVKTKTYGFDLFAMGTLVVIISAIALGVMGFIGNAMSGATGSYGLIAAIIIGLALSGLAGKMVFGMSIEKLKKNVLYKIWFYLLKIFIFHLMGFGAYFLFRYLFGDLFAFIITSVLVTFILLNVKLHLVDKFSVFWNNMYDKFAVDYRKTLDGVLNRQGIFVLVIITIFFIAISLSKYVGSEFVPQGDMGYISISLELPPGTNFKQTNKALTKVESALEKVPQIESFYTVLGQAPGDFLGKNEGVQYGEITIQLIDRELRDEKTKEVVEILKAKLADIPAAAIYIQEQGSGAGGEGAPLQIEITGEDLNELNKIAERVINTAKNTPGTLDIKSSSQEGVPEIQVLPNRKKMADYGVSLAALAGELRSNIDGNVATKYRLGNKEYDIRVLLDKSYLRFAGQIRNITIKKDDQYIPITELATLRETSGPTSVLRKNKQRLVIVSGNVFNRSVGEVIADIGAETANYDLPDGYSINFGGQAEIQEESFTELSKSLLLAIILSFIVLAAIMESYIHPVVILSTLPLALIGVILSLVITGKTLSIISLMAIVMLVGIVVNNGILLIDYMQKLRGEGMALREAILEAASVRLRPIIMTNLATAMSMVPLALELGEGSEMRSPMAIVSIGALITSTIFTLFIIPILYNVIETLKEKGTPAEAK